MVSKNVANSWPSASNFKSFSRSLEQFFLTVGQNNFGNKIPFPCSPHTTNYGCMMPKFQILYDKKLHPKPKFISNVKKSYFIAYRSLSFHPISYSTSKKSFIIYMKLVKFHLGSSFHRTKVRHKKIRWLWHNLELQS